MRDAAQAVVADADRARELAAELEGARRFAMDLEFVSEDRYVPDLALVQIAWGPADEPHVAAIDPLVVDPKPFFELVGEPGIEVVMHAARQDLGLIGTAFGIRARGLIDTQIAAAFAGIADQIGYARMIQQLFDVKLDKGSQFTDWMRRPLSGKQLRYALDDVRHLLKAWDELERRLEQVERIDWAREESDRLAEISATRRAPEDAYQTVGGWHQLRGTARSVLRALAEWREREALSSNTPPSWIASDSSLVDLARRAPDDRRGLRRVRGLSPKSISRYGESLIEVVRDGHSAPMPEDRARSLSQASQARSAVVMAIIQARTASANLSPRLIGGRSDADDLVAWYEGGASDDDREGLSLLHGWRYELAGKDAVAWLGGELALACDRHSSAGVRTVPL